MGGRLSGRGHMYTFQHNIKLKLNYPPLKLKKSERTCGDRAVILGKKSDKKGDSADARERGGGWG